MSRKHFVELARAISELEVMEETRFQIAKEIGLVCLSFNNNFDWLRWYSACGVEE